MDKALLSHIKGHLRSAVALKQAMDAAISSANETHWRYVGYRSFMEKYQQIVTSVSKIVEITAPIGTWDISKVKSSFETPGLLQKEYFEAVYTNLLILIAFLEHTLGVKSDETRSLVDFFQANMRKAIFETPKYEKQVQDVIEQLLIGRGMSRGIDYEREKGRVRVSIKEVVPDFIIYRLSLAIEVKLCKSSSKAKSIVDEINTDIQSYSKSYDRIVFIVYDIGGIQNEEEFKNGLETENGNIQVIIVKH